MYRPGDTSLTTPVYIQTYLLKAITGIGYLALTWSTVVLLGGFVTSLQRKDFWCLTVISMMQAARIFNDLGEKLAGRVLQLLNLLIGPTAAVLYDEIFVSPKFFSTIFVAVFVPWLLFLATCYCIVFFYGYGGPIACIALTLWRIGQRDYGSNDGDVTKANLAPALDLFYVLILCQGALYMIWLLFHLPAAFIIASDRKSYKIPRKWGYIWLVDYLVDTREKCWRDTASIEGRTISRYAADLIHSESWGDQLSGTRMLATFIKQDSDVRTLLLSSRPMVQKLIDTLGWKAWSSREMRETAACIVAHLAGDIQLAQFPAAIRCISTLLQDEATLTYWWNCDQQEVTPQLLNESGSKMLWWALAWGNIFYNEHVAHEEGSGCNKLILQGLTILERLASDHHNCMDISNTPGLVPKIMAPPYSNILIQGVKNNAWAEVVNGSFKVLYRLIRCPGLTGESLRREVAASQQAISNLDSILEQSNEAGQELQMRALENLTELALDSSTNLSMETKENLMKKQLEIFFDEESSAISKELKDTAVGTLVFLTNNSEVNSSKNNSSNRIIAAVILKNICAHCDLDKERVKDILLPQVLAELLSNQREPSQHAEENMKNAAPVDDEENQNSAPGNDEQNQNNGPGNGDENHKISAQEGNTEIQKISSTQRSRKQ